VGEGVEHLVLLLKTLYHKLMFSIVAKLRQSEGFKHSALTIFSYSFASAFSALAIILISRLLGPVDFADFSVAFSLSLILNRLNDFGFSIVIQKIVGGEWRHHKISAYLSLILKYRLVISLVLLMLGLFFATPIASYLQINNPLLIPLTFISSLPVTYFEISQVTLQSLAKFKLAAYNYLLPSVLKFVMALMIFLLQIHNVPLILSLYMFSCLPGLIVAEWLKPRWIKYQLTEVFKKEKAVIFNLLKHSAFALIAAGVIDNIDIIFAKHYLSNYEAGLLAGVSRIAMLLYVVAYSLASVLNPRVTAYHRQKDFDAFLKKAWSITVLAVLGFFIVLPLAPFLVKWTIGAEYLAGMDSLIVLLAVGFLSIIVAPFAATFYAFKSNRYFSISAVLQLSIMLLGNLIFVPQFGLAGSVYTRLVARVALLLLTWMMLWGSYRKEFGKK
jgi:O-antigen/teichoic acid export membrane protein